MDDNQFAKQALAVVNAVGIAVITGYFAAEYVFPYLKRRFFLSNSLKQKLQVKMICEGVFLERLAARKYPIKQV